MSMENETIQTRGIGEYPGRPMFTEIFGELRREIPEIDGVAVVSSDGRTLEYDWMKSIEPDKIGAVASALLGLGKKAIEILGRGDFMQVLVNSSFGMLSVYRAGDRAVLVVSVDNVGNLGLLNLKSRQTARRVAQLMEQQA